MSIAISDDIIIKIRRGVLSAYFKTCKSCEGLLHTRRDLYPRMFRGHLLEELAAIFSDSIPESKTTNYYIIKPFGNLSVMVITFNDIGRNIQKNIMFDETGFLPFDEFKEPDPVYGGNYRANLIYELSESGEPYSVILKSCDCGFDPIMIVRDMDDFLQLKKISTGESIPEVSAEKPLNDFTLVAKQYAGSEK